MAEKGKLLTGARARFSINGTKVGYARNVSLGEQISYEPVEVLDNVEIEEFVPVGYSCTFTAGMFRIVGETLKSMGLFPGVGGNVQEHLENILLAGDLTATIEDTKTGKLIATVQQVKIASHNISIDARGITGEDVEFVCIRILDESEVT